MTKEELEAQKTAADKAAADAAAAAKGDKGKEGDEKQPEIDPKIAELMKDPDAVQGLLNQKRAANDEAKQYRLKLEAIEKRQKETDDATLKEQGKFKELAEKAQGEMETLRGTFKAQVITSTLKIEAVKAGMIDADDVALVDRKDIKVSDDFSQVDGAKEAVDSLKKAKPYLFEGETEKGTPGREDRRPNPRGGTGGQENLTPRERIERGLQGK